MDEQTTSNTATRAKRSGTWATTRASGWWTIWIGAAKGNTTARKGWATTSIWRN